MGKTDHHLQNGKELKKKLEGRILNLEEELISHDIISLITDMPIAEAMELIISRLEEDKTLKNLTNLNVVNIIDLHTLICDTTYFQVDRHVYQ